MVEKLLGAGSPNELAQSHEVIGMPVVIENSSDFKRNLQVIAFVLYFTSTYTVT